MNVKLQFGKVFFVFLSLILSAQTIWAGIIRGTVTDKRTGEPLTGATIQIAGTALGATAPMSTGQNYCPSTTLSGGSNGYIGAFENASDNWLEGWTNFDPQNTIY